LANFPFSLEELRDFTNSVINLTSTVKALESKVDRLTTQLDLTRQEVVDLKTDLKIATIQIKSDAKDASIASVCEIHDKMSRRITRLEQVLDAQTITTGAGNGGEPKRLGDGTD